MGEVRKRRESGAQVRVDVAFAADDDAQVRVDVSSAADVDAQMRVGSPPSDDKHQVQPRAERIDSFSPLPAVEKRKSRTPLFARMASFIRSRFA